LQGNVGLIDGKLVFMKISAKAAGGMYDPHSLKNPIKELWDDQVEKFNNISSPGINRVKQTAGLDWCLMMTEIKFVETMYQGLTISIVFAFLALLCATSNIIMAFYASLTIGMIIINVMAIIPYMGWQTGSSESVGVVICVGFAVDYVVHLASHYTHSKH
jgi:hypothetical protein